MAMIETRPLRNGLRLALVLLMLIAVGGCAAFARKQIHGGTNVVTPLPADLSHYGSLGFRATSSAGASPGILSQISSRVVTGIRNGGEFASVVDLTSGAGDPVALELLFDVSDFNDVTSNDRFWMGGMAGSARIIGPLTLRELKSGKVLAAAVVTAYTDNMNTRSGTTEDAIQRASFEIVAFMTH